MREPTGRVGKLMTSEVVDSVRLECRDSRDLLFSDLLGTACDLDRTNFALITGSRAYVGHSSTEMYAKRGLLMSPQDEAEIRVIIALHREIEEKKKDIFKRLGVIRDRERASENKDALMFVVDGEILEMGRWAELAERVTPVSFEAWCLQYRGKAL
jgi:hypothetical protein